MKCLNNKVNYIVLFFQLPKYLLKESSNESI